jgi:hypothetical protein
MTTGRINQVAALATMAPKRARRTADAHYEHPPPRANARHAAEALPGLARFRLLLEGCVRSSHRRIPRLSPGASRSLSDRPAPGPLLLEALLWVPPAAPDYPKVPAPITASSATKRSVARNRAFLSAERAVARARARRAGTPFERERQPIASRVLARLNCVYDCATRISTSPLSSRKAAAPRERPVRLAPRASFHRRSGRKD